MLPGSSSPSPALPAPRVPLRHLLSPQLFLNAKCNMIRDRQVLEKQLIHQELAEEEKRLDKMMEMERDKGREVQEELERHRKQELMRWAEGLPLPLAHSNHTSPVCAGAPTMGSRMEPEGTLLLSYPQSQAGHCETDGAECRGEGAEG